HARVQLEARPLVEAAARVPFDLLAKLVREAPAPGAWREAALGADLEYVQDRCADEPFQQPAGWQPGDEHQLGPHAPHGGERVEAEHAATEPDARNAHAAKFTALARRRNPSRAGTGPQQAGDVLARAHPLPLLRGCVRSQPDCSTGAKALRADTPVDWKRAGFALRCRWWVPCLQRRAHGEGRPGES